MRSITSSRRGKSWRMQRSQIGSVTRMPRPNFSSELDKQKLTDHTNLIVPIVTDCVAARTSVKPPGFLPGGWTVAGLVHFVLGATARYILSFVCRAQYVAAETAASTSKFVP